MSWIIYFSVAFIIMIIGGIILKCDKYADDDSLGVFIAIAVTWPVSLIIIIGGIISLVVVGLIDDLNQKIKKK